MKDLRQHIIDSRASILEALGKLNTLPGGRMTLFVTGNDGRLAGTLTDGDIRRALIAGATPKSEVSEVCHRNFRSVSAGDINPEILRDFRLGGLTLIPVLDTSGCLADIIDLSQQHTILPLSAVLMA